MQRGLELKEGSNMEEIKAKKHLGQNFLGNETIAKKISELVPKNFKTLEIGPGLGMLTQFLVEKVDLTAFEIDENLVKILKKRFKLAKIVCGDALKTNYDDFDTVCGLLPYNVSSQIIEKFVKSKCKKAIFVIQKELAERTVASPGTHNYSRFSILVQNNCNCKVIEIYGENEFWPAPKVKSALIVMEKKKPLQIDQKLVNALFQHKNQKVKKALKHSSHLLENIDKYHGSLLEKKVVQLTIEEIATLSSQ